MRRLAHPGPTIGPVVAEACERVRAHLAGPEFAAVEAELLASAERRLHRPLREAEPGVAGSGTKPLFVLVDGEGRTFILKIASPELVAAEEAVWVLRQLGRRPTVPARRALVDVAGLGAQQGLLKPGVDLRARAELGADTSAWTELQRAVMLLEHAWEWFLGNLDTNTTQYALLGPDDVPVNVDWDRAFATDAPADEPVRLSRFLKYRPVLPNARTFLYADFIEGKIELPFSLLAGEAARIRHLPRAEVEGAARSYARDRFTTPGEVEVFVQRLLERRRFIEYEVAHFVRELRRERSRMRGPAGLRQRLMNALTLVWDRWQLLLEAVQRGPLGGWGRRALKLVRARRAASG
jgi:hypothetical protein